MRRQAESIGVHPFLQNGAPKSLKLTHFPNGMVFFGELGDVSGALRIFKK